MAGGRILKTGWRAHESADQLQESILKDTQCVLGAYVTMYIAKERNRNIAQVRTLASTLLVHYIC